MEIYLVPSWVCNALASKELPDNGLRMHLGYFLSNLLVVAMMPLVHLVPHFCLMRVLIGVPCPGCGVTHALLLAMSLSLRESAMANPAGLILAATIAFQLLGRPLAMAAPRASSFVIRASRWLGQVSFVSLLIAWVSTLVKLAV